MMTAAPRTGCHPPQRVQLDMPCMGQWCDSPEWDHQKPIAEVMC